MISRLMTLLVPATLTAGFAHAAAPAAIAGYISAIDGRAADCLIIRGKKSLPARYWSDLLVGDQVIAKGECQIEIMPRDGPRRWLVIESNSPTGMMDRARRQTPLPSGLGTIQAVLGQMNEDLHPPAPPPPPPKPQRGKGRKVVPVTQPAMAKTLPAPLLGVPLLSGPVRQKLFMAAKRFNLTWVGGKPPFTVTVAESGENSRVGTPPWVFGIGEERVVSSVISPHAGAYEVRITDAAGASVLGVFDVVDTAPVIDQHDLIGLPPEIAAIVTAVRLSNAEQGVWRLEAQARLAELGRDDYAAALLASRLRDGRDIPDSPQTSPLASLPGR